MNDSTTSNLPAPLGAGDMVPAGFGSAAAFKLLYRAGELLAASAMVPDVYKQKPADCALIVEIALRIDASPMMVAQSLDIIYGRCSWRSTFLIACVNRCGRFSAMRYEWRGAEGSKERACRAWATELATGDRLDGTWITWKMIEAEGWNKKTGSKWLTMPEQMFQYRAAAFWTRAYAPDIALGFPTQDEVLDTEAIDVTPTRDAPNAAPSPVAAAKDAVRAALDAKSKPGSAATVDVAGAEVTVDGVVIGASGGTGYALPIAGGKGPTGPAPADMMPAPTLADVLKAVAHAADHDALDLLLDMARPLMVDGAAAAEIDVAAKAKRKALGDR